MQKENRLSFREMVRQRTHRFETEIILTALNQNRWNRRKTAAQLQISYRALLYKMKDPGLRDYKEKIAQPKLDSSSFSLPADSPDQYDEYFFPA